MSISIEADERGLIVKTPYSSMFVSELKRLIPTCDRQFDGSSKAWIVAPQHGATIQKLIMEVYREAVHIPVAPRKDNQLRRVEIRVEYVGRCKQRSDGSVSAYGHDGQAWSVILPETALRAFFNDCDVEIAVNGDKSPSPVKYASLYAALVIKPDADSASIKSAYRRMARLTHPDVNHEPDASEQFKAIQRAYEILSDPIKRRRYDAGLALEASLSRKRDNHLDFLGAARMWGSTAGNGFFRSPLRCGLLIVDGERKLSRVIVTHIHSWNDITREDGKVMVSSWPFGAENYEVAWV